MDLPVRWVEPPESMTQEDEVKLTTQEIHGCAKVTTPEIMVDCILVSTELYSTRLRSMRPSKVID